MSARGLPVLARASLRHSLRHPWQLWLSVAGIALGVAVVVSIDVSSLSAQRAFHLSTEAIAGRATHRLSGGPSGIDPSLYVELRRRLAWIPAAPIAEGHASLPAHPGRTFTVLGVDVFAESEFRPYVLRREQDRGGGSDLERLLVEPDAVLLAASAATELGVSPGDGLIVEIGARRVSATVVGLFSPDDELAREAARDIIVADIATAQEWLGLGGRLTRVDLILPEAEAAPAARELEAMLPPGVRLESAEKRSRATAEMSRAFELNLSMLSHLALVVGMFLIYNTMTFAVIQRRRLIGTLRAIGVTRRQVFGLVLLEALLLGLLGAAIGLLAGLALATELVRLTTRTINDLYFVVNVRSLELPPVTVVKVLALGSLAAVLAACVPAWEATKVAPRVAFLRSQLEAGFRALTPKAGWLSLAVLAASAGVLLAPGGDLRLGFAGLFGIVLGFALLVPAATLAVVRAARPLAARAAGSLGPLAVQGVASGLSRTAVAIAALMVALSAVVGVGVMVDSFRRAVTVWLETTLRADIYVSVPDAAQASIDPASIDRVRAVDGIAAMSLGRSVTADTPQGPVEVIALRMAPGSYRGFHFLAGEPQAAWRAFDAAAGVLITEPYAWHRGLAPGDRVELLTDAGLTSYEVSGVVRDYGSEHGAIIMARDTFESAWGDLGYTTLGLYLEPGLDPAQVMPALRRALGSSQELLVRSNADIRSASLRVFDRTFTVTVVLRWLASAVAIVGILSALMALALEKEKEMAVLRALGLTEEQVWAVLGAQSALMGLVAGLLSLPLGLALAALLVRVINQRAFGWSMALDVEPWILVQTLLLALGAALAAGLYPAFKMTRVAPAHGLREE